MRKTVMAAVGAIAAVAITSLIARRLTRAAAAAPMVQPRLAMDPLALRAGLAADKFAMLTSLWSTYSGARCAIHAVWGAEPVRASFAPTMRLSMRTPAAAAAPTWFAEPATSAAGDADVASRYVSIEPGSSPVVRILRATRFKPRRATLGAQEMRAAA